MATIREWLNEAGFNWEKGTIIYQPTEGDCPGWNSPLSAAVIMPNHPILTKEFDERDGGPRCPRFIAEDDEAIYFPAQYDGSTWVNKIWKDITKYLDYKNNVTPYPGGWGKYYSGHCACDEG